MKGTVLFFNVAKGFGFITGEDEKSYFVHESKIAMTGFRALLAQMPVEFEVGTGPDGRPQAWNVKVPLPAGDYCEGFTTNNAAKPTNPENGGTISLSIQDEQVVVTGRDPHVGGVGAGFTFAAYLVGGRINGFRFELPRYNGETVYLVLDPAMKEPVIVDNGRYEFAPVGSYLMVLSADGKAVVYNLGRRHQVEGRKNLNWAVIERRFEHCYDPTKPIAWQDTPTTPGLERDNDGFIPALEVCRQFLDMH